MSFVDLTLDGVMNGKPDDVYHNDPDYARSYKFESDNGGAPSEMEQVPPSVLKDAAMKHFQGRKPIPDFDTPNRSFIEVFKTLKRLGVKRNKFFLSLYDQELKGVDPFSLILPLEIKIRIQIECIINPWYWLRECCRIPMDGMPIEVGGGSPFLLDRNNVATWYLFLNGIDHYGSKPRQCGKTQDAIAKFNYAYHYGTAATTILFFNKDSSQSRTNLYRLKCQRDMLPTYLQMRTGFDTETMKLTKETDNVTTMRNPINNNGIKTMPKATNPESAQKLGRGDTSSLQYYDEFDFTPYNVEILNSSGFAYSRASENARTNGALYCRIFTSTPGDADSRDGSAANKYISEMFKWKESYFDDPIDQLKKAINSKSYNGVVFVEHTWKQLGKSVAWYEEQCRIARYDQEVILREIELQRISGSNLSPFPRETLIYLQSNRREPRELINVGKEYRIEDNYSDILVYEVLNRDYPYILSIDPAKGLAGDRTAFVLINPYSLRIAAEFRSPFIAFGELTRMLVHFMDTYCPRSLIVVESNLGHDLLDRLEETKYRYHIYMDEDNLGSTTDVEKINRYGTQYQEAMRRRSRGFPTTTRTRPLLFNILDTFVQERIDDLYSQYLVEEILTLVRKPSGKIEHNENGHDDVLFAYLIGLYVYFNASNLEQWGIVKGMTEPVISGQESPEVLTQKMLNMLNKLPPEYQKMFRDANGRDPVKESENYAREVQNASRRKRRQYETDPQASEFDYADPNSDAWREFDQAVTNMNDAPINRNNSMYGLNDPFQGYDMFGGNSPQIGGGYNIGYGGNNNGGNSSNPLDDFFNDL